jgi:hypothetical protein
VVVVEMDVEVEATGRRQRGSSLRRWYADDEACFAVEKGMPTIVVTSIEWRWPFIGGGDVRRRGKKAREEVTSRRNKRWRANGGKAWRRRNDASGRRITDRTSRRPLRRH